MTVEILLATYNAEHFLQEQLDSLVSQSVTNWRLLIRDDGSTDGTLSLLNKYQASFPDKITIITDTLGNLGASGNFSELLARSTAPYIMFCDQDDVWLPNKIETTLGKMTELEAHYGSDTPLLVHTDLMVVDDDLTLLSGSHWRYQLSDPRRGDFLNKLLLQNVATGCTIMINRPLLDAALPIPPEAVMHDWWLVLVAAALGHIGFVAEPTGLYRQHGTSTIGAKKWGLLRAVQEYLDVESRERIAHQINGQALALLNRYQEKLPAHHREMLTAFVNLDRMDFFTKRLCSVKYGFYYTGLLRNIGRFLTM
jgi:glycosyltransferase involved in cell wall biosynthesis